MQQYNHKAIEAKWQKEWEENEIYKTKDSTDKPKCYILDMFPYPSGEGLHVGHPKGYIASDIFSRFKRMQGNDVLHPMGWDAFGLPAENYALKHKLHPRIAVEENIKRFKEQIQKIGLDYDWSREINTTDPEYYKWTQWIFLKLFENGLAYESNEPINWCSSCKTGLANEDLEGDKCERCGTLVEQKPMRQWMLKIRDYADRLLDDLDELPWPEHVKEAQRNWIGRSYGAELEFRIKDLEIGIKVFTTRPDTLFGATYLALSPEHALISDLQPQISNWDEVEEFIKNTKEKPTSVSTKVGAMADKEGVELKGIRAINPATNRAIPVWVADYVLAGAGTGAIMAVPSHDYRDSDFADKYGLPKQEVVVPISSKSQIPNQKHKTNSNTRSTKHTNSEVYDGEGILINSGTFDGMGSEDAREKITEYVGGKKTTTYRLRDWVFSRQRYWGEPIPLVFCTECKKRVEETRNKKQETIQFSKGEIQNPGWVATPDDQLPVTLPGVDKYEPTGTGESPLANIKDWVNTKCPKCGGGARRETNTMPQWAGSSWYYIRYIDPHNDKALVNTEKEKLWSPVQLYEGGLEHATRHLIYARFWHKFLYDIGMVHKKEPFGQLKGVGLISGEDGRKMSKRWGNVINPDDVIETYGADTLRLYEMFMGPFEDSVSWNDESIMGPRRFLEKVWRLKEKIQSDHIDSPETESHLHKTIKKVSHDIENFKFNTAVSQMMIFANALEKLDKISPLCYSTFVRILAPFAPHMMEELWKTLGEKGFVHSASWPKYEENKFVNGAIKIVVQVDGKVRCTMEIEDELSPEDIKKKAFNLEIVQKWINGKDVQKIVYVSGKLVNFVT
jgi:leucyl-tRNA synthetase